MSWADDLGSVMQSSSGRRVLNRIIELGGISSTGLGDTPELTAYNLGMRHSAIWLEHEMQTQQLDIYLLTLRERMEPNATIKAIDED